jgi:hypothetical protein
MTHAERPWNQARGNLMLDEPSEEIMKKECIREYYKARVQD